MKTVRRFINDVLEAGNWDIRDAFDDILSRDAEHDAEKAGLREAVTASERRELNALAELDEVRALLREAVSILEGPGPREDWSEWRRRSWDFAERHRETPPDLAKGTP